MNAGTLSTHIITESAEFQELRQEWTDLLHNSSCDCLFMTWEWMFTWWQHVGHARKLHLITVRQGSLLVAIAPLVMSPASFKRFKPFPTLEFLACGSVGSDYLSFIVRDGHEDAALGELGASLTKNNAMLELARVDATSFTMAAMALELKRSGWRPMQLTTNYSPFINLRGHSWDSYGETIAYSHRRDLRKKDATLLKQFAVRFEQVASEAERVDAMERFITLHLARWSPEGGSSALDEPALRKFHQDFSKIALERGWLRVYTMWLNDEPGAVIYSFKYGGVFYYYQTSFNKEFGKFGCGLLSLSRVIQAAIAEGAIEFDFLHDDEPYKYLWAREERELIRLDLFPPRYQGAASRNAALFKSEIKRMLAGLKEATP
jgi:CelD/BcsL family acetyltransferase involved in cellulose biosynthesis